MPKESGQWSENEPISATKLNANDKLNIREIRVGAGLGFQRNPGGMASITLDEQNKPWPIIRATVTTVPGSGQPMVAGVTPWDGTNHLGAEVFCKVLGPESFMPNNELTGPVYSDILITQPFGGIPYIPGDEPDGTPLLDPNGLPVTWMQISFLSHLFWGQFLSGVPLGQFNEVIQRTTSGSKNWQTFTGGRTGTVSNLTSTPGQSGASYGRATAGKICLIFETYDYGVSPPLPVYYAITDTNTLVQITSSADGTYGAGYYHGKTIYPGAWGNAGVGLALVLSPNSSNNAIVINLEEAAGYGAFAPPVGFALLGSGQIVSGSIITTDQAGTPYIAITRGISDKGTESTMDFPPDGDIWSCPGGYVKSGVRTAGGFTDNVVVGGSLSGVTLTLYTRAIQVDALGRVKFYS